jgi:hypothetical protein
MRRSYGLSGPISCGAPLERAFSAMYFAIWRISASLSRRNPLQSITMRLSSPELSPKRRRHQMLQCLESLAAPADQRTAVFAFEVDPCGLGRLLESSPSAPPPWRQSRAGRTTRFEYSESQSRFASLDSCSRFTIEGRF